MTHNDLLQATQAAGGPIEQAVAMFMLHPETFAESIAAGYENPFAGYVAGRGGVLGEATGVAVSSVFVVFEPTFLQSLWEEGIAVRGAAGAADLYWEQTAGFGRRHLVGAAGLDRLAELGRRSSRRHRAQGCRCTPAGGRCRWPMTLRRGRCR